ncbi:MAG: hypothetical protein JHD07_25270 [Bradyrhizobium sp.]|jgi:hypothetical protein|uniref:hypothetical protein n=1 Tax=Bradyrhizobium sp. TaxID=376 RepID=UPI001A1F6B83|nr:hypothetical protein [Bradyrhizobium sp.]MBJ7406432.1 hypothetical protein [Bradyrhizobium sp.]
MNTRKLFVAAAIMSLVALPAMAQSTPAGDDKSGGHHYTGGPKAEPHHMGRKESMGSKKKSKSGGSHHYGGGPKTDVPHHMGPKKEQ